MVGGADCRTATAQDAAECIVPSHSAADLGSVTEYSQHTFLAYIFPHQTSLRVGSEEKSGFLVAKDSSFHRRRMRVRRWGQNHRDWSAGQPGFSPESLSAFGIARPIRLSRGTSWRTTWLNI